MATMSSPQRNDPDLPRQSVSRPRRAVRTGLLLLAAGILIWAGVGAYQFAATYGSWYEHTILVGGIGALLSIAALMAAHGAAPWRRPTRVVSIVLCLLVVAAVTAAGTIAGDLRHTAVSAPPEQADGEPVRAALGASLTDDTTHEPEAMSVMALQGRRTASP